MAVPKKKLSRSRRDMRRANHDRISAVTLTNCSQCGEPMPPHRACPSCGVYRGRQVVEIAAEGESTEQPAK
ncbi:MAG: 50S ribosomal protein L32 [Myxococcota bacterium]|nr:50S ribosomal protein L32 [Myxococcota bacterium]